MREIPERDQRLPATRRSGIGRRELLTGLGTLSAGLSLGTVGVTGPARAATAPWAPHAQYRRRQRGQWVARHGLTGSQYQRAFTNYARQGYRLTNISGYTVRGQPRFAAIWEKRRGPAWVARHGMTSAQYQTEFSRRAREGYRLTDISGYTVRGQPRFAAIWEKRRGPAWVARHGMTGSQYQTEFSTRSRDGYRLVHVSGYGVGGSAQYAAIWEKRSGPAWVARHGMTSAQYQTEFSRRAREGYRLVHVSGYSVRGGPRFAAIWEKRAGPGWVARHDMTSSQYQGEFESYAYQGYRLVHISGYSDRRGARYAAIWESEGLSPGDIRTIDRFLDGYRRRNGITGLSVAITRDERLVFAKGYGFANSDTRELVRPSHRFRVASISKPITAVAIMELVETNQLALDDPVFGSDGVLGTRYGTPTYGPAITTSNPNRVTVDHLLEHTSGWQNTPNDPMFNYLDKDQEELIEFVVANRPLQTEPGTSYQYSNFGYCVLGRIIEAVSGQSYEDYVRTAILAPAGISRMEIAGDTEALRKSGEVTYYGSNAYNIPVARMDAHGGWVGTPIDLCRFLTRVDGQPRKRDILDAATTTELYDVEGPNPNYGEGWTVMSTWRGHNGAMPGSLGFMVQRTDGFAFAALANTRPSSDRFGNSLKQAVDNAIDNVDSWPSFDLF
ncbi:serine hydrolase [Haloarchaeobius sp. TZWSO28]|uniref:serine hydrolase n=1 Tax=Haloarchaeobius sp. TZWSO28 TaxID=3446119 RepID=UPI003EB79DBB